MPSALRRRISRWAFCAAFFAPQNSQAIDGPPPGALLQRLAISSARFESALKRTALTVAVHVESVDGDGAIGARKDGLFRIRGYGGKQHVEVLSYKEEGKDKTAEAREKAANDEARRAARPQEPEKEVHMPFLEHEQSKYSFRMGEADERDPARVRIRFEAREPAENLANGSAWVDSRSGEVLTMGFEQSKTPLFVDYFRMTMEFGATTSLGAMVSLVRFEGKAGFLFFRKHFRGFARFSDYRPL